MARAKKEAALTPEERLQAALVPDWEWPYKLPENWCWTYLTKAAECLDNFRKPINATERAGRNGNVPYYGATGQVGWIDDFLTDEDLVLLGEDGAPFLDLIKDKAYLITGKAWVNNHAHILRSLFGDTGNRYLLHYLNSFNYAGYVNGTTRLKLTRASMDTIPIPIPPLAEQQRIVDRIESLFAKLDEAKEKAQAVVDSFETRKAAILHILKDISKPTQSVPMMTVRQYLFWKHFFVRMEESTLLLPQMISGPITITLLSLFQTRKFRDAPCKLSMSK